MISRSFVYVLVCGLILLGVAFGVLMAFYALVAALGDPVGARVLFWAATICLIALVIDMVMLLAALGLRAAQPSESPEND